MDQLPGRQVYLVCLEGALSVNDMPLNTGDALKIWDESEINADMPWKMSIL